MQALFLDLSLVLVIFCSMATTVTQTANHPERPWLSSVYLCHDMICHDMLPWIKFHALPRPKHFAKNHRYNFTANRIIHINIFYTLVLLYTFIFLCILNSNML